MLEEDNKDANRGLLVPPRKCRLIDHASHPERVEERGGRKANKSNRGSKHVPGRYVIVVMLRSTDHNDRHMVII